MISDPEINPSYGKAEEKARKRGQEHPRAASVQQSPRCDQLPDISKAPSPQLTPKRSIRKAARSNR